MNQPIERAGAWWHQGPDGSWQRWDEQAEVWLPSAVPPPPPPPPPMAAVPTSPELQFTSFLSQGASAAPAPANRTFIGAPERAKPRFELPSIRGRASAAVAGIAFIVAALGGYFLVTSVFGDEAPEAAPVLATNLAADDGSAEGADKGSSKKRFIARADAICATMMTQQKKIAPPTTLEGVMSAAAEMQGILRRALTRLKALDPPARDRRVWAQQLNGLKAITAEVDVLIAAALRGDAAGIQAAEARVQTINDGFNRWATRYGFKVCNQES